MNHWSGTFHHWSGTFHHWSGTFHHWSGTFHHWSGTFHHWSGTFHHWSGTFHHWSGTFHHWSGLYCTARRKKHQPLTVTTHKQTPPPQATNKTALAVIQLYCRRLWPGDTSKIKYACCGRLDEAPTPDYPALSALRSLKKSESAG